MMRNLGFAVGQAALLVLFTASADPAAQAQFGMKRKPRPCWGKQWPR